MYEMKKASTKRKTDAFRSRHERICPVEIFWLKKIPVIFLLRGEIPRMKHAPLTVDDYCDAVWALLTADAQQVSR